MCKCTIILCLVCVRVRVWDLICATVVAAATAAIGNKQLSNNFALNRKKKKRERKCVSACVRACGIKKYYYL